MSTKHSGAFRPDIQGLRAIAVIAVIAFHAGLPMPGGFVGVDVFFVISGFVITAMLHREWLATGAIRFRTFYLRRFKRLTPALAVMVAVTVLLSIPLLSPIGTQQTAAKTALGAMFLVANFVIGSTTGGYFQASADLNPLLNTWSLSVEEQFYLVFPAVLALGWLVARKTRWVRVFPVGLVVLVAVVSFATAYLNSIGRVGPRTELLFGFYGPVSRAWEFAVGALLAMAVSRLTARRGPTSGPVPLFIGGLGAAMVVASLWLITEETPFPGPWTLLPVLGTALVIAAGSVGHAGISKVLSTRPMVAVGDRSYSLYLWHWPVIVFAGVLWPGHSWVLVAAALISILPAVASYRWVEQPFRLRPYPGRRRMLRVVAFTILIPSILAAGLWVGANRFWGLGDFSVAQAVKGEWEFLAEECMDLTTTLSVPSRAPADGCQWNAAGAGTPVYLAGDSAAAQYLAGVKSAAQTTDSPLRLISAAHCPLTVAQRVNNTTGQGTDAACSQHNAHAMSVLTQAAPGVVFLANSNRYWYVDDDRFTLDPTLREVSVGPGREILASGISDEVKALQAAGHKVVLISPTYTFLNGQMPTPDSMPMFKLANKGRALAVSVTDLEAGQQSAREVIQDIATATGADLLDVTEWQCPQRSCPAFMGTTPAYADSAHLSQPAAALLAERFRQAIEPARSK